MPVEPSDIGWTPWVRQPVQLSAAEIFLAEPPEPRRRRNSRTASRIPPSSPTSPSPRSGEFAVCLSAVSASSFFPLGFQRSSRSDAVVRERESAPGRGVSDRTAPASSCRRVSISRNAEEWWLSGRVVVEWVSALMRWQVEVQPIPCCCRRLALVTGFDRPECPPLDPPVACSPTLNQPSTTPGQGRGGREGAPLAV